MTSINYIPDPDILAFASKLEQAVQSLADNATPQELAVIANHTASAYLTGRFREINALEGSIWVVDELGKNLVPIFNSGSLAENFVLKFKQPIYQGIISMVYATEMPFLETDIRRNKQHDESLDKLLQFSTESMAVVPLHYAGSIRGVISAINFSEDARRVGPPNSDFEHYVLNSMQSASKVTGKLIDSELKDICLGKTG